MPFIKLARVRVYLLFRPLSALKLSPKLHHKADLHSQAPQPNKKTYNSEDSPVVTDPSTNSPLLSLTKGERTGSRIF
ncbi:hypothetical protein BKA56DRAFT_580230 [Ilyonectria sp. MPI-CAGE-AT-0026]|nr:hypothetical protein BKA56DRAFT_580230 [Ilyonectria sp. MPI-CAGE-AT-0026]